MTCMSIWYILLRLFFINQICLYCVFSSVNTATIFLVKQFNHKISLVVLLCPDECSVNFVLVTTWSTRFTEHCA